MDSLLAGLVGALLATNQPAAVSNVIYQRTGEAIPLVSANDPVEREFREVMIKDDKAQQEVDRWIVENNKFAEAGAGVPKRELNARIMKRFESVRQAYEDFLKRHPDNARAHLAFASFLDDINDQEESKNQMEKARELNPGDPAVWNNLANYYGHYGAVTQAFAYYNEAIRLNPNEPIYYQNFGTTVFLFRKDAREFYIINEQQVFDKALELYSQARKLAPDDFELATDVAQTYYGIRPWRFDDALGAWTNALNVAQNQVQREGVYIHLARISIQAGRWAQVTQLLNSVTNPAFTQLRDRVAKSVEFWKTNQAAGETNWFYLRSNTPAAQPTNTDKAGGAKP